MTSRRRLRAAAVWLALYTVFLAASPFEHHDVLCELKTPRHCTACTSNVVGSDPAPSAIVGSWTLTDVGLAIAAESTPRAILLSVRSSGRSPPASA